ncbi:MAG: signal transduction protein [Candidatus Scalindua rubra]|uniref:Signal transduction protein n=1 Tax=Candidatus Scalindua rubra TaxID=1872076 RepID=A0A1E3XD82_9BACT|nr:MAG: signal transduction protein [Candidatus Scalindua rubra]
MLQRVKDVMYAYVVNIHGITKVSDALSIMKDENIQTILVRPRNDDDVYGLITLRDIATKIIAAGKRLDEVHAYEIMTKPVLTVDANMPITYAARFLTNFNVSWAPVMENGELVGMVSLMGMVWKGREL